MSQGFSILISRKEICIETFFDENKYDSFYYRSDDFDCVLEGIILNKKDILKKELCSDFVTFFAESYQKKGLGILNEFEGEFRGIIWDKKEEKLFVFTNPTATQRVFYSRQNNQIFVDSDLVRLSETMKSCGHKLHPDITSIYQLVTIGNLLENRTPVEGIFKMLDARILEISRENMSFKTYEYFSLNNISYYNQSKEKAIDHIHEIFSQNIQMEYEKDTELESSHLTLLSGGLDSRMAMMYALKNQFKIDMAVCFSQSGYFDEKISRKIAADYDVNYEFIPLDKGSFLKKIDELTRISEGTSLYTGGLHVSYALDQLKFDDFSIFHGGQIGDGILGGFNSEPRQKPPSQYKIIINPQFLPKIQGNLDEIFKKYDREEIFLLKNLAYNRTVLGSQVFQQKAYHVSPFMTKDLLTFSFSLPEEWKYKHKFYLQWLSKHCSEASKYTWERTLMNPDAEWKTAFGEKYMKGFYKKFYTKILKQPQKTSMYPYQYYYDSDESIKEYYQEYFNENIDRLSEYPELRNDITKLFSSESFYHKCQAINVLSVFKLYF